jgi:hypothetical protein
MTATIGPDGFCTRCQLVADWCECDPPGPVAAAFRLGNPAGPDPDPDLPDPDPPAGPPGDDETAPLARFDLGALMASGVPPPALLCGGLLYAGDCTRSPARRIAARPRSPCAARPGYWPRAGRSPCSTRSPAPS